jgi:hypothetical protein
MILVMVVFTAVALLPLVSIAVSAALDATFARYLPSWSRSPR